MEGSGSVPISTYRDPGGLKTSGSGTLEGSFFIKKTRENGDGRELIQEKKYMLTIS
jgi:hypothetical protein